ncbi:MAG: hypothetical protein ACRC46_11040 [Thermoguttaceae bacterium]
MFDLSNPYVRLVLGFCGVSVVTAIGFYIISRIRAQSLQQEPTPEVMLQNFREMHTEGVLDDTEFRTIRKQLSERVVRETVRSVVPLGLAQESHARGTKVHESLDEDSAADETRIANESLVETRI